MFKIQQTVRAGAFLAALLCVPLFATSYPDGTIFILDGGATSVKITNSGPQGGTTTINVRPGGRVWFSIPGYPETVGTQVCADPCGVSPTIAINMEYGRISYWHTDLAGNNRSSRLYLPFVPQPNISAPFTVPSEIIGFSGFEKTYSFSIAGGTDVSNRWVYLRPKNLRQDLAYVRINGGAKHTLGTTPVVGLTSNGSVCTLTTSKWLRFTSGTTVQLNYFHDRNLTTTGNAAMNGYFVATVTGLTTFTVPCSIASGDWNTATGVLGGNYGKTVSSTTFYLDQIALYGGINSGRQTLQIGIPLGSTELVAGATNTITFGFEGDPEAVVHGWWLLDFNIISPPQQVDQIVVTSLNAVARTTSAHGIANGSTVIMIDAPGPSWRFNGKRVLTAVGDTTHFTFLWGSDLSGETAGVSPYTTANGTYVPPTSKDVTLVQNPKVWVCSALIPYSSFQYYDPSQFTDYGGNAANGATLWSSGTLKTLDPYFSGNDHASLAKCSSCHAHDAYDLKVNGISTYDTLIASLMRGVNESDSKDVTAYVQARPYTVPAKGRPWNGIKQPGPGLDTGSVFAWNAGAGDGWYLTHGEDMKEFLFPGGVYTGASPSGTVNVRELPVSILMPHWIEWLPEVAPEDFCATLGLSFTGGTCTELYALSQTYLAGLAVPTTMTAGVNNSATTFNVASGTGYANNDFVQINSTTTNAYEYVQITGGGGTTTWTVVRAQKGSTAITLSSGWIISNYTKFRDVDVGGAFLGSFPGARASHTGVTAYSGNGSPFQHPSNYGVMYYDLVGRWYGMRLYNFFAGFGLENMYDVSINDQRSGPPNARAGPQTTRGWMDRSGIFNTGAHIVVQGQSHFMNVGPVTTDNWARKSQMWYHLENVIGNGNRLGSGNIDLDWGYTYQFNGVADDWRPDFYIYALTNIVQIQQTWGQPNLPAMTMQNATGVYGSPFRFSGQDLLTPDADIGAVFDRHAKNILTVMNTFSVADFRTFIAGIDGADSLCTTAPPDATQVSGSHVPRFCDGVAYMLPKLNYYQSNGVSSATVDSLETLAASIWSASGYDFAARRSSSCSFALQGGFPPTVLNCP